MHSLLLRHEPQLNTAAGCCPNDFVYVTPGILTGKSKSIHKVSIFPSCDRPQLSTAHAPIRTQPSCYCTNMQSRTTHITNITSPVPTCAKTRDRQWMGSCELKVFKALKFNKGYKQSVVTAFCHSKASTSKLKCIKKTLITWYCRRTLRTRVPFNKKTYTVNKCVLTLQQLKGDYQQNVKWRCEGST
jgi:hypothetical protein